MAGAVEFLDGLGHELKRHGVKVKKVPGWKERGRPYTFTPRSVFEHHTASLRTSGVAPALGIVTNGRSDLPGPLANFVIGRDGTVFFVAAGYCNHGGYGGPHKGIPKDSANKYAWGIEIENDGRGEPYSRETIRAAKILTALLLKRVKRRAFFSIGHKEWAPTRKIDPSFAMDGFRKALGKSMRTMFGRRRKRRG